MTIQDRPGPPVDPTALLALHGSIRPRPWLATTDHDQDAYSLFHSRAIAMGWTPSPSGSGGGGLWGMNEADQLWSDSPGLVRLAWFQVGVVDGGATASLIPLLRCAVDTVSRIGEVDIGAFQMLLPVQVGESAWRHLLSCLNWFRVCEPHSRTAVRVTVDAGPAGELETRAEGVLAAIGTRHTAGFAVSAFSADAGDAVVLEPELPFLESVSAGSPVTFDTVVPEWSGEAVGVITGMLIGAFHDAGLRHSLRVNVVRAGPG